jgi:methyl-accepting chemotaxis protein
MKTGRIALRVTLNSALMILVVYFVMQIIGYLRDNIILGITDAAALPATIAAFLGANVLPPLIVFSAIVYVLALPIQKVGLRLEAGESLSPDLIERTRLRILGFSRIKLAVNLVGFAAGFLILQFVTGHAADILRPEGLVILVSNLAGAAVYATAQSALDDLAFAPVRERLGFQEIGDRKRELRSTSKQVFLTLFLSIYVLTFLQFNTRDIMAAQAIEHDLLVQVKDGAVKGEDAAAAYRSLLGARLKDFSTRSSLDVSKITPPWERGLSWEAIQVRVFLLYAAFMFAVAMGIQAAASAELRDRIAALQRRLKEVVAGGGDLRSRISLRAMDDLGELAGLVNQLLDLFGSVVHRIGDAAERTRAGAAAIDRVLSDAESSTRGAADAAQALESDLAAQAESSRALRKALDTFRGAVKGVDEAAEAQVRSVSETSSSMEEMASSIRSVETMTRRSGDLALELTERGRSGGDDARATRAAIAEIEEAAAGVLKVLSALSKIAGDTNLLAMNAAIEAAHAGERGAGFAVVADEVRALAANASAQTKSIKNLIQAMSARVAHGVARAEASGRSLSELVRGLEEAAGISREIAEAMGEQAAGTRSAADSLVQVVDASRAIEARMAEQEAQTSSMASTIESALGRLDALLASSRGQAEVARSLKDAFGSVRAEVDRSLESTMALTEAIRRFGA